MSGYLFAVVICVILVISLIQLMRTRRLREKYAAIWIALALGVVTLGAFPGLAVAVSSVVGVEIPANLVFATAIVVLLIVCVQLSIGMSNSEERLRTLTEEVALIQLRLDQHEASTEDEGRSEAGPHPTPTER